MATECPNCGSDLEDAHTVTAGGTLGCPDCDPRDRDDAAEGRLEWFVVEELEAAVVAGPFEQRGLAVEEATDCGGSHVVIEGRAIDLVETASDVDLTFEVDD